MCGTESPRLLVEGGDESAAVIAAEDASIGVLIASHSGLAPGERLDTTATVLGRLTARRKHGVSLVFLDLAWSGHKVQLVVVDCDGSEGGHLAPLGSLVRAGGMPGRTVRGELSLFCSPAAVELLQAAVVAATGPQQPPSAPEQRFHVTPNNVRCTLSLRLCASAPLCIHASVPLSLCLRCRCAGAERSV